MHKISVGALILFVTASLSSGDAFAQLAKPEGDEYSVNDFGGIGLLQTRTARFAPDGQLNMGASFVNPYRRYFVTWQILPQLEATFRYTDVQNVRFGAGAFDLSQGQFFDDLFHLRNGGTNLDRGFDIKFKLLSEGKYNPAIAVGLQDFIGTGLFSGEYFVASKQFGSLDVSLGLGWGVMGNRAHFGNPFSIFGEKYNTRTGRSDLGGLPLFNRLFTGPDVALFGGVEYFTHIKGLSVKVEYNSTDQTALGRQDSGTDFIKDKSAIGVGVNYRLAPWFDVSLAWERGTSIMIRGAFRANLNRPGVEKVPMPIPRVMQRDEIRQIEQLNKVSTQAEVNVLQRSFSATDIIEGEPLRSGVNTESQVNSYDIERDIIDHESNEETPVRYDEGYVDEIFPSIQEAFAKAGFWAYGLELDDVTATVYLSRSLSTEVAKNVGMVARIVSNFLPSKIEKITVVELIADFEIYRVSVMRSDIEREARYFSSSEEIWSNVTIHYPRPKVPSKEDMTVEPRTYPSSAWWIAPELSQHLGDPAEGIYLADIDLEAGFSYTPMPGLSFNVIGRQYIAGSLDNIRRVSDSALPHVRSDLVSYLQQGRTSIKSMQVDYIGSAKSNWYYRIAAGLFEPMFGGVGAEVLYRPYGKPWALSVELDWVKQRAFNQLFSFRDYEIVTGHATLNYDLPWYGLRTTVSAGRYLAGDYGMTFEVSRRFDNGVRVGAFFTRTNVSAADFGEGSFDKGFYIKFPFSVFLRNHSKQEANFLFRPLTRDGGQKVGIGPSLFELVDRANYGVLRKEWQGIGR
ncbi:MAG: YjbH domain-containing protein [Sphingomonadales bacterium]|nr:YjbH domain-containing protein [Sphingomonadales bacterium]